MENFGEQFLHKRDPKLHTSEAVEHEKERLETRGEETSQKPAEKISDWLEVIKQTHTGHRDDPRVLERIKNYYHKEYVIDPNEIPEGYYENQKRLAREQGHGDIDITEEMRKQLSEVVVKDQETTLDNWVEYFTSPDADAYPMWAKYWAFTSMLKLSTFDKEKHTFAKRDKGTVAPFPDINREALAYVVDAIIKKANNEKIEATENNPELKQLLDGASFGKLYAYAIEKVTPTEKNELETTEGEWIKYDQNSDHMPLVNSLQGYGTGWCTAGESTAEAQLKGGDFYVYYSNDKEGKPTIPRVAIRMSGESIGEVRGIAHDQNMDPYIGDVVKEKLAKFPDGKQYEKKEADMKLLTKIENKTRKGENLNKDELIFIYEIDNKIEGFGYQRDPRIKEILDQRNPNEDAPIVFECEPNQIAHSEKEINKNTKAYIGPLFKDIFKTNIEHIYTSFPESSIKKMEAEIGGKNKKELVKEMEENKVWISDYVKQMMDNPDFTTSKKQEHLNLVRISVKDLGFPNGATTDEIYEKAKKLGLELCPAEVGPQLRLQQLDQSNGDWFYVGMKQISDSGGYPVVFVVSRFDGGRLKLGASLAESSSGWDDSRGFVFRFPRK